MGEGRILRFAAPRRGSPHSMAAGTNCAAGSCANAVYSLSVGYAPNGDVISANDSVNGNWVYVYGNLHRLQTSNQNNGQQAYSYVYDRFGNRWQQKVNGRDRVLIEPRVRRQQSHHRGIW
jgi:hypothetical protein